MSAEKIINADPASYPYTATPEFEAVICLLDILDKKRIKPDPKILDKFPNTDGFIELTNEEQIPIGELNIQIKKIKDDTSGDKIKYQCDLKFLAYCEGSVLPVILIVVDTINRKAYWEHISIDNLKKIATKIKKDKDSVSLEIPSTNCISSTDKEYFEKWKDIYDNSRNKLLNYDVIKKNLDEFTQRNNELLKITTVELGKEDPIYREIHIFLDYLNGFLDKEFSIIKKIKYGIYWKIGLAYYKYIEKMVNYVLYPIKYTVNDVQIKKIVKGNESEIYKNALRFVQHNTENPIKSRPEKYALEIIKNDLESIINNKILFFIDNSIANEYLISFIDMNHYLLGLEKDLQEYKTEELENGINLFIHLWLEEAGYKKDPKDTLPINIDFFRFQMAETNIEKVYEKALIRLKNGEKPIQSYYFYSTKYNLNYLMNLIDFLNKTDNKVIKRFYTIKEKIKKQRYFKWETYRDENLLKNLQTFFNELPEAYNGFIQSFFPLLQNDLSFFTKFNKLLIIINPPIGTTGPVVQYYYLKTDDIIKREDQIEVLLESNPISQTIDRTKLYEYFKNGMQFHGLKYKLIGASGEILDFIYEDLPLQHYLYRLVKERLKEYFNKKIM